MANFIVFNEALINTKDVVIITKEKGINKMEGKFSLTIHIRNYDNIIKWFDNETERNEYFNHLCVMMCKDV